MFWYYFTLVFLTINLVVNLFGLQRKRKVADRDDVPCSSGVAQEMKEESVPVGKKMKSESKANGATKPIKTPTVSSAASSNIRQTDLRTTATGVAKAASNRDDLSNPTCRDAFKSIFTSGQSDQVNDKSSNWITCNSYK